jgi:hypothetical protein
MESSNKVSAMLLAFVLVLFIAGGYILMYKVTNKSNVDIKENNKTDDEEIVDLRIDNTKDYIYYENESEFFSLQDIIKSDVVLNFTTQTNLTATLKNEVASMFDASITKISDTTIPEGVEYQKNDLDYYSFKYREYSDNKFENYVSLVVLDYSYDIINGSKIESIKSYVIDKSTGNIIDNEKLLQDFNMTEDKIIEQIKTRLNNTQVLDDNTNVINIDETITQIKESSYDSGVKALSISKNGNLTINFIVKSNKINYNDSIELN